MKMNMIKTGLIAVTLLLNAQTTWASDINAQALSLVGEKKFSLALELLSQQDDRVKQSYDHRFLQARILSWAGRYPEARATLNALMTKYPGNADLQVAMGNLEYYQGNLDAAQQQFQSALDQAPNYTDARNGLSKIEKARRSDSAYRWRIDGGAGLSGFDVDRLSNWNEQFLRAEYVTGGLAYSGSVTRYERFGKKDLQLNAGLSDAVHGRFDWGVNVGIAPDSDFRPNLSLGGRAGQAIKTDGGTVYYIGASYQYDDYDTGEIHTIQPTLQAYLKNGTVLTGRLIGTLQKQGKDQLGWLTEARTPLNDQLHIRAGYARAPEAINGVAITTESLFGGLSYDVNEDTQLHLNLSRDDRENTYIRESVNVGFTHKR